MHSPYTKEKQKFFPDWWWRFDRYKLDGGYIRPAKGATVQRYEPWDKYGSPSDKTATRQPYHGLLELTAKIDRGELPGPERNSAILTWCGKHGLLGVLLHRSEWVALPIDEPGSGKQIGLRIFRRETRGWRSLRSADTDQKHSIAVARRLGTFGVDVEAAEGLWGPFFPGLANAGEYPAPFSDRFWREYSEPIEVLIAAAMALNKAVVELSAIRDDATSSFEAKQDAFTRREELIHSLTATVRPMIYVDESPGGFGFGWSCGSLLSNFAMMAVLDFTRNRLLTCANASCQKLFVTKATQAKYCSEKCRAAVQMRNYRINKKRREADLS